MLQIFRLLLAIIVNSKWKKQLLDKSAFPQRNQITKEVYSKPPFEAGAQELRKLNISVYVLVDTPHAWYLSLKSVHEKSGTKKSKYDDSVFYLYSNDLFQSIICFHVEDFYWEEHNHFNHKLQNDKRVFSD